MQTLGRTGPLPNPRVCAHTEDADAIDDAPDAIPAENVAKNNFVAEVTKLMKAQAEARKSAASQVFHWQEEGAHLRRRPLLQPGRRQHPQRSAGANIYATRFLLAQKLPQQPLPGQACDFRRQVPLVAHSR